MVEVPAVGDVHLSPGLHGSAGTEPAVAPEAHTRSGVAPNRPRAIYRDDGAAAIIAQGQPSGGRDLCAARGGHPRMVGRWRTREIDPQPHKPSDGDGSGALE